MPTYLGRTIVTPPSTPWPASIEPAYEAIVGANTNPFNQAQQLQDWGGRVQRASVSFPPMTQSNGQAWVAFLKSCAGQANVFLFDATFVAAFPDALTTDGTTQPYWCLEQNDQKWTIKEAKIYGLTFEVRQAL